MKYCPYCRPSKRITHIPNHIEYYINKFLLKPFNLIDKLINKFANKNKAKTSYITETIIKLLSVFKIVNIIENPDKNKFLKRSWIFWEEAKKRKLNIKAVEILGQHQEIFKLVYNNNVYYFDTHPLSIFDWFKDSYSKIDIKNVLINNNIPTPKGKCYTNNFFIKKDLRNYFSFPLVVKPNEGSLSHHLTTNINNYNELKKAINKAKIYSPEFIIEEFINGDMFRATVINNKYVFICKKEKANIIGDGKSSIQNLINKKNSNPNRGDINEKNTTLHKIPIDNNLMQKLEKQNLSLQDIPPKNKKVYLQDKYILSQGCDIIDMTAKTHKDNKNMFIDVAKLFDKKVVGIDFIAQDISKSYKNQKCGTLETNELPYMDMHKFPSHGKAHNIEQYIWEEFFNYIYK